jgi:pyruvate, water dikinase
MTEENRQVRGILTFSEIGLKDIELVGGKNASLGELYNELRPKGIAIPDGFALTAGAYRIFRESNGLEAPLRDLLKEVDHVNFSNLAEIGSRARALIQGASMPDKLIQWLRGAYHDLSEKCGVSDMAVAVRSSATAEDLPTASFAGRMESFLNISGPEMLVEAVHRCFGSLFTDRAIKYRYDMGFENSDIAISVGVQQMVRSDLSSSGVAFTIDPDTGFRQTIVINGIWGLGENIVQGRVTPDEWLVFKPTLNQPEFDPVIRMKRGEKEFTMVYGTGGGLLDQTIVNNDTPQAARKSWSLVPEEVRTLARWCLLIEQHYGKPMDIEWAKDGITGEMFIVQARPETVQSQRSRPVQREYRLKSSAPVLTTGIALGEAITAGKARVLKSPDEGEALQPGEILITDITNPDWDMVLKRAGGIVTNKGGRTSHAAIVARELGTVAVVGTGNATAQIRTGQPVTVSCAEGKTGKIYDGVLEWEMTERDFSAISMPATAPMLILADPSRAFELSRYPNRGVGLLRLEFAISNSIRIHPLALTEPERVADQEVAAEIARLTSGYDDPKSYFTDRLAEAVAQVAAAFWPEDVIVRMSDFKSNEYANLLGGKYFEPEEENPMIGLRGASRYYSDFYRKGFALECAAMKKVREEYGMKHVKLMIPFCRTPEEGRRVLDEMAANGLVRGENGLEVYVMVEIPSNVLQADELARLFDGFSIGSNDLTQLTLGLDRDSALVSHLFSEENTAVKTLIAETIRAARRNGIKVGLCGQAPSDLPAFAEFLVSEGIGSISFNPDALLRGIENILAAESKLKENG